MNSWVAAAAAWILAVVLVVGVYALWQYSHGQPIDWMIVRKAAIVAVPLAFLQAWRDRNRA